MTVRGPRRTPQIPGLTCDDYHGIDDLGDLLNYGSRAGEWTPSGPVPAGAHPSDPQMLNIPEATNFCKGCDRFRPDEKGLSHVEIFTYRWGVGADGQTCKIDTPEGTPRRVVDRYCRMCRTSEPEDYYDF